MLKFSIFFIQISCYVVDQILSVCWHFKFIVEFLQLTRFFLPEVSIEHVFIFDESSRQFPLISRKRVKKITPVEGEGKVKKNY